MGRGSDTVAYKRQRWIVLLIGFAVALAACAIVLASKPADAATPLKFEAEKMQGFGKVFIDRNASRDRGRLFEKNRSASKSFSSSVDSLRIRARGTYCGGAARMVVSLDGRKVMSHLVSTKRWNTYSADLNVASGSHRVTTKFVNARKTSKCTRDLRVDLLNVIPRPAPAPTPKQVVLGVHNTNVPYNMIAQDQYVSTFGREPTISMGFQSWGPIDKAGFCKSCADTILDRGSTFQMTWASQDYTKPNTEQPEYALKTIVRGDHDTYIRSYAHNIASWGRPIQLRFDPEMNGDWMAWGNGVNGNTPADYVAAWKHVYSIFQQEGATNVEWVWSPNAKGPAVWPDNVPLSAYYPGDAYVDWVALDGYNWGTSQSWSKWHSFAEIFGPSYKEITALTNKPLMIAETGSSEVGGDKAAWIRTGLLQDIPTKFPKIQAVIYHNRDDKTNLRLNSSSQSVEAWKGVVNSQLYQGKVQ